MTVEFLDRLAARGASLELTTGSEDGELDECKARFLPFLSEVTAWVLLGMSGGERKEDRRLLIVWEGKGGKWENKVQFVSVTQAQFVL